jgi:hypothetical protein
MARYGLKCPHCKGELSVRNSKPLTVLVREMHFRCKNDLCGAAYLADLQISRQLLPSQMTDPRVELVVQPARGYLRHANDDCGPGGATANDNRDFTSATGWLTGARPRPTDPKPGVREHRFAERLPAA